LIADDELDLLNVMQRWLLMHGFKLCLFTDGLAALKHLSSNSKDHHIVICNIRLPDMSGNEFAKQVKEINSQVKVILTGSFEMEDKQLSNILSDTKADAYIQKPYSLEMLRNVIQEQYQQGLN
jgi:DNA-binding response OmpR family regulator